MIKFKLVLITLIIFALFSCKKETKKQKINSNNSTIIDEKSMHNSKKNDSETIPVEIVENCNQTFEEFLSIFGKDSVFQKRRVRFPLIKKYTYLDDNNKDTTEIEIVNYQDYRFTDFSEDKDAWKKTTNAFKVEIKKFKDSAFYKLRGIDNGIFEDWIFIRVNDCWVLKTIDNRST